MSAITVNLGPIDALRAMLTTTDPIARSRIYKAVLPIILSDEKLKVDSITSILAANSLGSLTGDLVSMRALSLLKVKFPVLTRVTTDFTPDQAKQGQVVKTRVLHIPACTTYSDTTGWGSSDASMTDVSLTIGQPRGVQIELSSSEIGKTNRNLFGEQVEAMLYALGRDLVGAVYALMTEANFPDALTLPVANVSRATLVSIASAALNSRAVPQARRTLLVNLDAHEKLLNDGPIVQLGIHQKNKIFSESVLPELSGFECFRAVNLPTTGNLHSFAMQSSAIVLATRVPEDYTKGVPAEAVHGATSLVTDEDTGFSVMKVDFVDHKLAKAFSRMSWAYGCGVGQAVAGQIFKSS
ncbi:MAG TPA: hypothetical protein PLN52_22700 [Opitutaceae bacterium]|nr:hypothetical protein [Opitutaceae bacterium]